MSEVIRMNPTNLSTNQLRDMFIELIINYSDPKLKAAYMNDILDEDEKKVGNFRLVYGYYEQGYLSFLIFFQEQQIFNVYCIEKTDYIIDCTYDKEKKSWMSNNCQISSKLIQCLEKMRKIL